MKKLRFIFIFILVISLFVGCDTLDNDTKLDDGDTEPWGESSKSAGIQPRRHNIYIQRQHRGQCGFEGLSAE